MRLAVTGTLLVLLLVLGTGLMTGCGGGGGSASSPEAGSGLGRLTLCIHYADGAGRMQVREGEVLLQVSSQTQSFLIDVLDLETGTPLVGSVVVQRESGATTQTVSVLGIPPGTHLVRVLALDSEGSVVAHFEGQVTIVGGQSTSVQASLTPGSPSPSPSPSPSASPSPPPNPPAGTLAVALLFGEVALVNTDTLTLQRRVAPDIIVDGFTDIEVSADRQFVYVSDNNDSGDFVRVMRLSDGVVVASPLVGSFPWGVKLNPAGTKIYASAQSDAQVTVIDAGTNGVLTNIPVQSRPHTVDITPDGSTVFVPNNQSNSVSVISTTTDTVIDTLANVFIGTQNRPWDLDVSPDGTTLWVSNANEPTLAVYDLPSRTLQGRVTLSGIPRGVAISPDNSFAVAVMPSANALAVIDPGTLTQVATIPLTSTATRGPGHVLIHPTDPRWAYVSIQDDDRIFLVNVSTRTQEAFMDLNGGDNPRGMVLF